MPYLANSQLIILLVLTFLSGAGIMFIVLSFILSNDRKRPSKPVLLGFLSRYKEVFYDARYESLSDVEFMKFVRDNAWVFVWMSAEMEYRLRRKVKKDGNYIPKRDKDEQRPDGGKGI